MTRLQRTANAMVLLLVFLGGCASTEPYMGINGNVVGKWKFKDPGYGPQTLTFRPDQIYELDADGDGTRDVWGHYRISREWLFLNDVGGDFVLDCAFDGVYLYNVKGHEMTFSVLGDQCPSRNQALSVEWVKVSNSTSTHKMSSGPTQN